MQDGLGVKTLPELQAEHAPAPARRRAPPAPNDAHEADEQPRLRNYVRDLILGFNDGVVSTYAVCAGVAGAAFSTTAIGVAGVAAAVAGALSMGLGEYLSTKSQSQYYRSEAQRERSHIRKYRDLEVQELREMLIEREYPAHVVEPLVEHLAADEDRFVDFMMREEFGVGKESDRSPVAAMAIVMASFVLGAALPVLPFFIVPAGSALAVASGLSLAGLFAAGATKGRLAGLGMVRSGGEMAVLGGLAAALTYGIGTWVGVAVA